MTPGDSERGSGLPAESTERWVSGKSEQELLQDLKVYSARLRDDPHSTHDRLRVAAIQLRLGRVEESLVHYEGVLRAYVAEGQVGSAIALCRRILNIYPDLPRLQRILAALYARLPHREAQAPTPVTPIHEDSDTGSFVVRDRNGEHDRSAQRAPEQLVVDRIFRDGSGLAGGAASRDLLDDADLRPTLPYDGAPRPRRHTGPPLPAVPLTQRKRTSTPLPGQAPEDDGPVVLLTKKKKDR